MKYILRLLVFLILLLGFTFGEYAERTYQEDGLGFFVIEYNYTTEWFTQPLTNPIGDPHYSATITIYQIINDKKVLLDKPFSGVYIVNGCWEDKPETLVKATMKRLYPDEWEWSGQQWIGSKQ